MSELLKKEFWKDKKVLITGHTGFKGAWLSLILKNLEAKVYGLSHEEKDGIYKAIKNEDIFEKELFYDITHNLENSLLEIKFDHIFHFAAQSLVGVAYKKPKETLMTNIIGTWNILELFNKVNAANTLTIATTDKVYKIPNSENRETAELGGSEYYSLSKSTAEQIIDLFIMNKLQSNKYISVIRSGNVIGGGDMGEGRLIPDILNYIRTGSPISLRKPEAIRPWQHVLDSLHGYILATQYSSELRKNTVFNLNSKTNNKYTVLKIVEELKKFFGSENEVVIGLEKYKEVDRLTINSEKASELLGWEPILGISKSLNLIYEWEMSENKFIETNNQIKLFFKELMK